MTVKKKRRLAFAAALVAVGAVLAVVVIYGLGQNTMYFRSPTDIADQKIAPGVPFRLGGLVQQGSVAHGAGAGVRFAITDGKSTVPVTFSGVLPALFHEGQGVVTTGVLSVGGIFEAKEVLAKHDEKYMPPEVVDSLKRSGRWKEGGV
jgi:cytochrome c-type biogenesis protein CcmE